MVCLFLPCRRVLAEMVVDSRWLPSLTLSVVLQCGSGPNITCHNRQDSGQQPHLCSCIQLLINWLFISSFGKAILPDCFKLYPGLAVTVAASGVGWSLISMYPSSVLINLELKVSSTSHSQGFIQDFFLGGGGSLGRREGTRLIDHTQFCWNHTHLIIFVYCFEMVR